MQRRTKETLSKMIPEILKKVAKSHKIDLDHFDEVDSYINDAYTFIYVTFAERENLGGEARRCNRQTFKLSVSAILKRGELWPEEYTTNGWQWIR